MDVSFETQSVSNLICVGVVLTCRDDSPGAAPMSGGVYVSVLSVCVLVCRSDVALLYNDKSVLESHHLSAAFRLLKDDELNVLAALKPDEYRSPLLLLLLLLL